MVHTWSGFCQKDHFYGKSHMPVIFALNICWKIQNEQVWSWYHLNYLLISFAWVTIWNMVSQSFCTDLELPQGHANISQKGPGAWLVRSFCFIHLTNLPVYHEWHCHICLWKKRRWELNGVEREWFLSKVTSEKLFMHGHCECLCWFLVSGSHWCFLVEKETRRVKNTNTNRSLDETQKWRNWGPRSPLFCAEMTVNLKQTSTNLNHPL